MFFSEKFDKRISLTTSQIQTKFSRPPVQDPLNAPYSMEAPLEQQVHASIQKSLQNLRHDDNEQSSYIDTLILHSPYPDFADTIRAWRVFESYIPDRVRALGISNITLPVLKQLYAAVETKPAFVQLRFHSESEFAAPIRRFCAEKDIVFQAHKVLKGNQALLESDLLRDIASEVGVSREMALYLCVLGLPGSLQVVNGTKSEDHMREDLDSLRIFQQWYLSPDHQTSWDQKMILFKGLIGD
jgi:diketogulonate reductase-like aldo/keto reductase